VLCSIASSSFATLIFLSLVVAAGSSGPFWSMPSEFLTGVSAASGLALIILGCEPCGFVGPIMIGLTVKLTSSLRAALALASFSMFKSAMLAMATPREMNRLPARSF